MFFILLSCTKFTLNMNNKGIRGAILNKDIVAIRTYTIAEIDEIDPFNGESPLIFAIENANIEVVRELLELGANPNLEDNEGFTPLTWAIKMKSLDIIYLLIEKGADPYMVDMVYGNTFLHFALLTGNEDIISAILNFKGEFYQFHDNKDDLILQCLSLSNIDIFNLFIEKDLLPNDPSILLDKAVDMQSVKMIRYVASLGKEYIVDENQIGDSILCKALELGRIDIFHLLVELGLKPKRENSEILTLAVKLGNILFLEDLLDKYGLNPLLTESNLIELAINLDKVHIAILLMRKGVPMPYAILNRAVVKNLVEIFENLESK